MRRFRAEIADMEQKISLVDEENEMLRGEIKTLETGKQNGKTFSMRELEKFGNVNLRASANKSLI